MRQSHVIFGLVCVAWVIGLSTNALINYPIATEEIGFYPTIGQIIGFWIVPFSIVYGVYLFFSNKHKKNITKDLQTSS